MARTVITPTPLAPNAKTDVVATTINSGLVTAGVSITPLTGSFFMRVTNTAGAAHPVIIRAGAYPPGALASQGDLTVTVALTSGVEYIGPFETARFAQADGSINVDLDTGHTGALEVYSIPKGY